MKEPHNFDNCLGFDAKKLRLSNRPLSHWKNMLKPFPRHVRRHYFLWSFRWFATLYNIPIDDLPESEFIYCYIRLLFRNYYYDGLGI